MAKVINKRNQCEKMLQLISWREIFEIYVQCLSILFYMILKNVYHFIKFYFDKIFNATRHKIVSQFRMLSVNAGMAYESNKVEMTCYNDNHSMTPSTANSCLGVHKYIVIKVV
jgi:hypothetical protein